ncbi:hypothetical protein HPC38_07505 [Pasteurellaceae bacterium HPA106]|uniref:YadA-like family protein n=1 Tax=Spirabiliibacterium pneumoniae TaxID=221400 RepID=UPI001AAC69DB|nr:YadA-like family protein [Spirabiliibacterium pneumoniae]MBE2896717.1 hypothetical protein [Spirabiliibacterium pneumoniae]
MNTIFKIIWNHATQSFVVASELAKGHTKSSARTSRRVFNLTRIGAALSLALGSSAVMADNIVNGEGSQAVQNGGIAIGVPAKAETTGSIAIGNNAVSGNSDMTANYASVINPKTKAPFTSAEEMRDYILKANDNDVVKRTWIGKQNNIAIGSGATAMGGRNISVGENAGTGTVDAWNIQNVNIGTEAGARSKKDYSVAIGFQAGALSEKKQKEQLNNPALGTNNLGQPNDGGRIPSVFIGKNAGTDTISYGNIGMGTNAAAYMKDAYGTNNVFIGADAGVRSGSGIVDGNNFKQASWGGKEYLRPDGSFNNPAASFMAGFNVGIGPNAQWDTQGSSNSSLGWKALQNSLGSGNTAMGNISGSFVNGDLNVAMGNYAGSHQTASRTVALGNGARTTGNGNVALGSDSWAGTKEEAKVKTGNGGSVGGFANTKMNDTALGFRTEALGGSSLAAGERAKATKEAAIAIGSNAEAKAVGAIALGAATGLEYTSESNQYGDSSIKESSINEDTKQAVATGEHSIAVGTAAESIGDRSTAIGKQSSAQAQDSIAQGTEAKAYGDGTVAIGKNARSGRGPKGFATNLDDVPEANAIAIGNNAQAPNKSSIAMGDGATVQYFAPDAIAIGTNAKVGTYAHTSIAIGKDAKAQHFYNTAIGPQTVTDGVGAAAVGFKAQALARASFAAGQGAKTEDQATVAIGENAKATLANNVSLGSGSVDRQAVQINDATVEGVRYSGFAGKASAVVSVGKKDAERQIINVAPGEISKTSTDAINGSQLYLVSEGLTNQMPVVYTDKDGNKVYKTPEGKFVKADGTEVPAGEVIASMNNPDGTTTTPTTLTNIAGNLPGAKKDTQAPTTAGTAPTAEEVKKMQNNAATVGDVLNAGWNLQNNGTAKDFVKPYDTVNFVDGANTIAVVDTTSELLSNIRINVTGLPIAYTDTEGNPLVKVGDKFYKAEDVTNGKVNDGKENANVEPAGTTLVNGKGEKDPQTLDGVKSAVDPDGNKSGDDFTNALNDAADKTPNKAVNVSDLKNVSDNIKNANNGGGFGLKDDNNNVINQDLGKQIQIKGKEGSGVTSTVVTKKDDDGKITDQYLQIGLDKDITIGKPAKDGQPGEAGSIGVAGKDGKDGVSIKGDAGDGKPGIGIAGKDGKDGVSLTVKEDGQPGVDGKGKDGKDTKPRLEVNGEEVATLNDGIKYAGDFGEGAAIKLNKVTNIKGNAKDENKLSDGNIGVVANQSGDDAELVLKLAKDLKDLDSVTFGPVDPKTGKPTDPSNTVSIGKDGINAGNKPITNINNGLNTYPDSDVPKNGLVNLDNTNVPDNSAATVGDLRNMGWIVGAPDNSYTEQVKNANQVNFVGTGAAKVTGETKDGVRTITIDVKAAEAGGMNGFDVTANDGDATTITEGNKVNFTDGNNTKVTTEPKKDGSGVDVKVNLADNITVGKDGKDGVDGSIGATGKDGASAVLNGKDGSIGLTGAKGADGKDGASASISVKDGAKGLDGNDGKDGESKTRVVYTKPDGSQEEVATLNDGLKFKGNKGDTIEKKLNETVAVKGKLANDADATAANTRVDVENGELIIKMAKMLKDLEGAEFKDKDGNTVIVKDGGIVLKGKDATDDKADNPKNVSLTQNGLNNGGNTITNVADGVNPNDAVNKSQLDKKMTGFKVTANSDDAQAKEIKNGDTVDFVNGSNTVVSKVDTPKGTKVKVDLAKDLKGLNSVELKDQAGNTTTVTGNGVNITGTNAAGKPSNVSLTANGLDNGGNRITNVAPGVKGTDAVNVNQLNAVGNRIGDVDRKARGGIAGSTAMANLPQAYIPGHSMVAVAAGTHRGANAVAVGVSRISDSGHVIIKLSGSTDSKGGTNAGVGVGYQW